MSDHLDVFISYRSTQFSWASRLAGSLRSLGFNVFLDHEEDGLRSDEDWGEQLKEKIDAAEHFLVLWSTEITQGTVVHDEIAYRRDLPGNRPMSFLLLDEAGVPAYLGQGKHHFRDLVALYEALPPEERPGGAVRVHGLNWNRVVHRLVREQLRPNGAVHVVPVVVVAMTRSQADELQAELEETEDAMRDAVRRLLAETAPFHPDAYGATPADWRPFDRPGHPLADPISAGELLSCLGRERMSWAREYGDGDEPLGGSHFFVDFTPLLNDPATAKEARARLRTMPVIVVLDVVSLLHDQVRNMFIGNGLHTSPRAFIVGVGPLFETDTAPLGTYLRTVEQDLFTSFNLGDALERSRSDYYPQLSACLLNVQQRSELMRLVQMASDNIDRWLDVRSSQQAPGWNLPAARQTVPPFGR